MAGEYVWYVDGILGNNIKKDWNQIHKVVDTRIEEDQNGDDGNVFVAVCGATLNGWANSASPIGQIGGLEDAKKTGLDFCDNCF